MRAEDRHAGRPRHPSRETHHPFQRRGGCRLSSYGIVCSWFADTPDYAGPALVCGDFADESVCRDDARAAPPGLCRALLFYRRVPCVFAPPPDAQVGAYLRDVSCVVPPPRCLRPNVRPPVRPEVYDPRLGHWVLARGVSFCPT